MPKHQTPHGQEPLQRQFKPDQKQQEYDTELGDTGDVFGVADGEPVQQRKRADQRAEAQRPQQRAGADRAKHRQEKPSRLTIGTTMPAVPSTTSASL